MGTGKIHQTQVSRHLYASAVIMSTSLITRSLFCCDQRNLKTQTQQSPLSLQKRLGGHIRTYSARSRASWSS